MDTKAWVLHRLDSLSGGPSRLVEEVISLGRLQEDQVLVEPLYGCWEGNMAHAIARKPIDVCLARGEDRVVLGNSGVVRVLRPGSNVRTLSEGDLCLVFCSGTWDDQGYPTRIYGYDAPNSIGILAKKTILHRNQLIKVPENSKHSLRQWAAFSLRYVTAWANWRVALACWRIHGLQLGSAAPAVWGWGGGVAFAEVTLATLFGFRGALASSMPTRLGLIRSLGIDTIDRREFSGLQFDERRFRIDQTAKMEYVAAEAAFLSRVAELTGGNGVAIFVDLIGAPVYRATLKALARPGVITSAGWKHGMVLSTARAFECMNWHCHVHTHYARLPEGPEAVIFAEEHNWLPAVPERDYSWDQIPELSEDYDACRIDSYFPLYCVNSP